MQLPAAPLRGVRGWFSTLQGYCATVRGPSVSLRPLLFTHQQGCRNDEIFLRGKAFQRSEPVVVIARAIVLFAALACCRKFRRERFRPFAPAKKSGFRQ